MHHKIVISVKYSIISPDKTPASVSQTPVCNIRAVGETVLCMRTCNYQVAGIP